MKPVNLKELPVKKIFYIVCFAALMGIDVIVGSLSEYIFMFTNNLVGVIFALIMIIAYKPREFLKPFYICWIIVGGILTAGGYVFWLNNQASYMMAVCITVPLNVCFLGLAVCKLIEKTLITKQLKVRIYAWEVLFALCMLLMTLSLNEAVWPIYYGIIFLSFFHTPFSEEDKKNILFGALDGIILGFIMVQGFALYNRPYDLLRYVGAYGDCNRNGCMYLVTVSALLARAFLKRAEINGEDGKKSKKSIIISGIYCVLSTVVITFSLFTGCRSLFPGYFLVIVLFILTEWRFLGEKLIICVMRLVCCFLLLIPLIPIVYATIRYIPAICDHPLYYGVGWTERNVQPRSPIDDYRYVSLDDSLEMIHERFFIPDKVFDAVYGVIGKDFANPFVLKVFAADVSDEELIDYAEPDKHSSEYMVTYASVENPDVPLGSFYVPKKFYTGIQTIDYRINIALVLLRDINIWGHRSTEGRFYVYSDAPSAEMVISYNPQNFIVYMLYSHGLIFGLMGIVLYFAGLIYMLHRGLKGDKKAIIAAFFWLIHLCMGCTEVVWIPGQIILVMMLFMWFVMMSRDKKCSEMVLPDNK